MRVIEYTFENEKGQEVTVKAEYTIVPFRGSENPNFDDDIEIFNVTENGEEVELEEEIISDLIQYIRENDEDDISEDYFT